MKVFFTRLFTSILVLLLFLVQIVSAQTTSNKGTEFWLAHTGNLNDYGIWMEIFITSDVATSGKVAIPGIGYKEDFTVSPEKTTIITIPGEAFIRASGKVEDKGILVTTTEPVVLLSHFSATYVNGSALIYPTVNWGQEYIVTTYADPKSGLNYFSEFIVVAADNNTRVQITPAGKTVDDQPKGVPFEITLEKGQVYQVRSMEDLSGSNVEVLNKDGADCNRIAVFAAYDYYHYGCTATTGDIGYQQLLPVTAWGKKYVTTPASISGKEKFRILASEPGTQVTINGGTPSILGKGEYLDFYSGEPNFISADKPVAVAQFPVYKTYCPAVTEITYREMLLLSPLEQGLKKMIFFSSPGYRPLGDYVSIVLKTIDSPSFRLDGEPVTFLPIPGNPAYSFAKIEVSVGNHELTANGIFNAVAFGIGVYDNYGYIAGTNIKSLEQQIMLDKYTYCEGESVRLKGYASYQPLSWHWDFGDGTTSALQEETHRYTEPGTYTVTLTTVRDNGGGCSSRDVSVAEVVVYPNPRATFTYEPECLNKGILFKDASTVTGDNSQVSGWLWDFGDGTSSTEQHPRHEYAAPGAYQVTLQVTTTGGCSSVATGEAVVEAKPVIAFDVAGACQGKAVSFTDKSTATTEPVTGWHWDFGDGTTSALQHPEHTYTAPGSYAVTLTLTFASGCQLTLTKPVVINPTPIVRIELPDVCILDEAQFVNRSTISSGTMTYLWEFGDGKTSTAVNPKHRYTAEKEYTVRLTATSDKGCSQTIETKYVVSGAYPKAGFTAAQFCQPQGVQFSDASSVPFGRIVRWEWDFGDGSTSTEQHPKHVYAKAATYQVTLKAYSGIICESIVTKTITVNPQPVARFQAGNVCDGEAAGFKSTSFIEAGSITGYRWDFGDGKGTSTLASPQYTYASPGTYPVTLTVSTDKGCQDSRTELVTVYPKPVAAFTPAPACITDEVSFRDESTIATGKIIAWSWNFGDGRTSVEQHPKHRYATAANYKVKLTVTTTDGCSSVLEKTVQIKALPTANAGPDQVPVCDATSTTLAASNPAPGTGLWTIVSGTGGQFSDPATPAATFSGRVGENYKLRWTVSNSPCASAWDEVEIRFGEVPVANAGPDQQIIEGEKVTLEGNGNGVLLWSPAQTLDNPSLTRPTASPIVTTTYTLTATSPEGCQSSDEVIVTVLPKLKIPNGISPNGDGINDVWLIEGIEEYPAVSITVFNRWGDNVHTEQGSGTPWDGTRNGAPLPDGAYYYVIDTMRGRKVYTGAITILR